MLTRHRRHLEPLPFPVQEPPPSSPIHGHILSLVGTTLVVAGIFAGGLFASGIIGLIFSVVGGENILQFVRSQDIQVIGNQDLLQDLSSGAWLPIASLAAIFVGGLMAVGTISGGVQLRERGRRLRARDARALLQDTQERPVFLLRSFSDDELSNPRPLDLFQPRYEESFSHVLAHLGPLVAIGRPGEGLGFSGAARLYVSDAHWQEAVRYAMARARAIVIIVGETESLWWEISTALEIVPRERLLFFFPHVYKIDKPHSRFALLREFLARWNLPRRRYQRMEEERRARYQYFLRRSALDLGSDLAKDLDDALFLDFLPDGRVRLLRSKQRPVWRLFFGFWNIFHVILMPRRYRQLRFDMARTLRPFLSKLLKHP